MTASVIPVIVEEWQFACCADPFAVGDLVSWRLSFAEDDVALDEARVTVDVVTGEHIETEQGRFGSLLTVQSEPGRGVTAFGPSHPAGRALRLSGAFAQDHHDLVPATVPLTTGRITRVREAPVTSQLRDVRGFADRTIDLDDEHAWAPLFLIDLQVGQR
ncbi:DUF6578 domain-containing protein [Jiangella ureilytica]|uniref:DUF6578 domain-containing protein n=1 Tax=Jiangella ureilytica TaxID=2530374 RepID=UPI0013A5BFE3|nr:DUF6578 domain-containing protein [Jiangella ureilytica]